MAIRYIPIKYRFNRTHFQCNRLIADAAEIGRKERPIGDLSHRTKDTISRITTIGTKAQMTRVCRLGGSCGRYGVLRQRSKILGKRETEEMDHLRQRPTLARFALDRGGLALDPCGKVCTQCSRSQRLRRRPGLEPRAAAGRQCLNTPFVTARSPTTCGEANSDIATVNGRDFWVCFSG